MGKQTETKTAFELDLGDRVVFPRGVIKVVRMIKKIRFDETDSYDVTFDDSSLTNYGSDEIVKVMSAHDGTSNAQAPVATERKPRRRRAAASATPEQPAKRTRRSVAQVERDALQRGIQIGIERAAKLNALNHDADKLRAELEKAASGDVASVGRALLLAFEAGKQYQVDLIALDNA
jgi:hypothetical protein